jgi:4-hydroxybenzoate decarboxylase
MRAYIERLMAEGRVHIVEREVSGRHELAAVVQASQKTSDWPILFRKVTGSSYPVISNVYGSRPRLSQMIGAADGSFCRRWHEIMKRPVQPAQNTMEEGDLQEIKLSDLPALTYFERDGGPYISAGVFLANDPDTGVPNLSFHRAQIISDSELRVRLGSSHHLTQYQAKAEARGARLPAAILVGAPPNVVLAAASQIAYDESELDVAGKIAEAPLEMRRCRTIPLDVPAETEIVIEGHILPNVKRPEGPFGEFMGFYVPVGDNHVFEISAVIARKGAFCHGLLCGSPEDMRLLELSVATQVYEALLAASVRGVIDVACVPTVMSTVVKIDQQYEGHAKQVLLTAIGANHDWNKTVLVVDDDVNIDDFNDVWWAYLTRGRADHRAMIIPEVPGFYRDPMKDYWGRLAIDATVPFGRKAEFERKKIPGADGIDLKDYLA